MARRGKSFCIKHCCGGGNGCERVFAGTCHSCVSRTAAPRVGRTDAERNCVSNIRPAGLDYTEAARKLGWLIGEALQRQLTGVALKDESDTLNLPRQE